YENTIMTYYNSCVNAASERKLDGNKITVSDTELEKVQIDGLVAHLSDNHSLCWDEVCWRKGNPDIQLREPHLKDHTSNQINHFREFLKKNFYIPTKQSLITHIRTSYNTLFSG
ncbi:3498_t:CDS:1, partial [Entrophospora sp. SA101]